MNRTTKFIIAGVIAIIIATIGKVIFQYTSTIKCQYSPFFGNDSRFHWLFQDSILKDMHKFYSVGNDNGAIYAYNYKTDYRFIVWELKEYDFIELKKIKLNENINMQKIIISPEGSGKLENEPEVTIESKLCFSLNDIVTINIGEGSKLFKELKGKDYRCFYGQFDKIGIIDESNEYQMLFTYSGLLAIPTEFILYKARNSFFIIIINALGKKKVNEETLNLLKLQ